MSDLPIFITYFCAAFAVTLPVELMPMIAGELRMLSTNPNFTAAAFVASVASLGGGFGKLVNGFVCQGLGGRRSSAYYAMGSAASLFVLLCNTLFGCSLAGLEFFSSVQWTACSLLLADRHGDNPARFAVSAAGLTLASTCGTFAAKAGGTALLHTFRDWGIVARVGSAVALCCSIVVRALVKNKKKGVQRSDGNASNIDDDNSKGLSLAGVRSASAAVLGRPLFW